MSKKIRSIKNFWGETVHYDESGKKIGVSRPNFWGGTNHYDSNGSKVGESHKNFWGGETHRDTHGNKIGESHDNFWGGTTHRDTHGKKVGETRRSFWGGTKTDWDDKQLWRCLKMAYENHFETAPIYPHTSTEWYGHSMLFATGDGSKTVHNTNLNTRY